MDSRDLVSEEWSRAMGTLTSDEVFRHLHANWWTFKCWLMTSVLKSTPAPDSWNQPCVNATSTRHAFNASMTWADMILAGHHQSLRSWILCLYLIGLNLSIFKSLQNLTSIQTMRCGWQRNYGLASQRTNLPFAWQEKWVIVYVIAGHKGQPEVVKKVEQDVAVVWNQKRDEERCKGEKPRFSRGIQPRGEVVLKMLPNVKQATIAPLLKASIVPGTYLYWRIHHLFSLSQWGMTIKVSVTARGVNHKTRYLVLWLTLITSFEYTLPKMK